MTRVHKSHSFPLLRLSGLYLALSTLFSALMLLKDTESSSDVSPKMFTTFARAAGNKSPNDEKFFSLKKPNKPLEQDSSFANNGQKKTDNRRTNHGNYGQPGRRTSFLQHTRRFLHDSTVRKRTKSSRDEKRKDKRSKSTSSTLPRLEEVVAEDEAFKRRDDHAIKTTAGARRGALSRTTSSSFTTRVARSGDEEEDDAANAPTDRMSLKECFDNFAVWEAVVKLNLRGDVENSVDNSNPAGPASSSETGSNRQGRTRKARTCTSSNASPARSPEDQNIELSNSFSPKNNYVGGFCGPDTGPAAAERCRAYCEEAVFPSSSWTFREEDRCCYCDSEEFSANSGTTSAEGADDEKNQNQKVESETSTIYGGPCFFDQVGDVQKPVLEKFFSDEQNHLLSACCEGYRLERFVGFSDPMKKHCEVAQEAPDVDSQNHGEELHATATTAERAIVRWARCAGSSSSFVQKERQKTLNYQNTGRGQAPAGDEIDFCPLEARIQLKTFREKFPQVASKGENSNSHTNAVPLAYLPSVKAQFLERKAPFYHRHNIHPSLNIRGQNMTFATTAALRQGYNEWKILNKNFAKATDGESCWDRCQGDADPAKFRRDGCGTDFCARKFGRDNSACCKNALDAAGTQSASCPKVTRDEDRADNRGLYYDPPDWRFFSQLHWGSKHVHTCIDLERLGKRFGMADDHTERSSRNVGAAETSQTSTEAPPATGSSGAGEPAETSQTSTEAATPATGSSGASEAPVETAQSSTEAPPASGSSGAGEAPAETSQTSTEAPPATGSSGAGEAAETSKTSTEAPPATGSSGAGEAAETSKTSTEAPPATGGSSGAGEAAETSQSSTEAPPATGSSGAGEAPAETSQSSTEAPPAATGSSVAGEAPSETQSSAAATTPISAPDKVALLPKGNSRGTTTNAPVVTSTSPAPPPAAAASNRPSNGDKEVDLPKDSNSVGREDENDPSTTLGPPLRLGAPALVQRDEGGLTEDGLQELHETANTTLSTATSAQISSSATNDGGGTSAGDVEQARPRGLRNQGNGNRGYQDSWRNKHNDLEANMHCMRTGFLAVSIALAGVLAMLAIACFIFSTADDEDDHGSEQKDYASAGGTQRRVTFENRFAYDDGKSRAGGGGATSFSSAGDLYSLSDVPLPTPGQFGSSDSRAYLLVPSTGKFGASAAQDASYLHSSAAGSYMNSVEAGAKGASILKGTNSEFSLQPSPLSSSAGQQPVVRSGEALDSREFFGGAGL